MSKNDTRQKAIITLTETSDGTCTCNLTFDPPTKGSDSTGPAVELALIAVEAIVDAVAKQKGPRT